MAGLGWGTLWYLFSCLDGTSRQRPYGSARMIAAITFGIGIGGMTGYGVYIAWLQGKFYLNYPEGVRALQLPDSRVASQFLDAFGRPDRQQTCACERQQDSTVGQALMLNNGRLLNDKLRGENSRVSAHIAQKTPNETVIREIFLRALGREPTATEAKKLRASMAEYPPTPAGRREAIEDVYWAALTSREFLFNH